MLASGGGLSSNRRSSTGEDKNQNPANAATSSSSPQDWVQNNAVKTPFPRSSSTMPPFVTFHQGQQHHQHDKLVATSKTAASTTSTHRTTSTSTLMVSTKVAPLPHREYHGDLDEEPHADPKGTGSHPRPFRTHVVKTTTLGGTSSSSGQAPGTTYVAMIDVEDEEEEAKASNEFAFDARLSSSPRPPPLPPPPIRASITGIAKYTTTSTVTTADEHKRLVRQQSEPVGRKSLTSSSSRRSIFDRYWKHEEEEAGDSSSCRCTTRSAPHGSPPPRPKPMRGRSTSVPAELAASSFWDGGLMSGYSPPAHSTFIRHREHFSTCRWPETNPRIAPASSSSLAEADPSGNNDNSSSSPRPKLPPLPHQTPALPPLPLPLQRFHTDGRGSSMAGMYPLVRAQSILRESSYRVKTLRARADSDGGALPEYETFSFPGIGDSLNLTRSVSRLVTLKTSDVSALSEAEVGGVDEDQATDATASSTSISSAATNAGSGTSRSSGDAAAMRRGVSFDPRITVTEFEDANPRTWFTDTELEHFRMETVLVAQKYLIKHPELIDLYNKPTLDPVTGTMRKRALFSMPALRAGDASSVSSGSTSKHSVDDHDDDNPNMGAEPLHRHRKNMTELAFRNVKSILVADRNKIILDLFRRSLRTLFPHARITTVQSGEEAWRHFESSSASESSQGRRFSYDIVIAEERLDQPLTVTGTPLVSGGKTSLPSCAPPSGTISTQGGSDAAATTNGTARFNKFAGPHHVRHDSLLALPSQRQAKVPNGCSGSELLRRISANALGHHSTNSSLRSTNERNDASTRHHPHPHHHHHHHHQCLLIGVSVQPDQERDTFVSAGADLVWGKPPPRMDDSLRDELVSLLLRKREQRCDLNA